MDSETVIPEPKTPMRTQAEQAGDNKQVSSKWGRRRQRSVSAEPGVALAQGSSPSTTKNFKVFSRITYTTS